MSRRARANTKAAPGPGSTVPLKVDRCLPASLTEFSSTALRVAAARYEAVVPMTHDHTAGDGMDQARFGIKIGLALYGLCAVRSELCVCAVGA